MSFVYFIGSARSKAVKIGVADNPRARVSGLQTGNAQRLCLLAEMPGDERYERALHRAFSEYRIRGEWFRNEGRLQKFLSLLPIIEHATPPKRRNEERARRKQEQMTKAEESRKRADAFWAEYLPLLREIVLSVGVDKLAKAAGARKSDVARSLYPDRGRRFAVEWLFWLGSMLDENAKIRLFSPMVEFLGFRLVTPELATQEAEESQRYEELRADVINRYGDRGRALLAQHDAEIATENERRLVAYGGRR